MTSRFLAFLAVCFLPLSAVAATAPAAKPFQKVEKCILKADRWNDGDSFHVITGDENREIIARLYFVDTPEAEMAYGDRIDEQAAYFGISKEQTVELAHEARDFTAKTLSRPFTVWTRWRSALGRSDLGRVYCMIAADTGEDLGEMLVANGLARIYGTRTPLPDGRDSRQYLARLAELETKAKATKKGGWRFATAVTPTPAQPKPATPAAAQTPPTTPLVDGYIASKKSGVFHKSSCKSVATISAANLVKYGSREEAIQAGKKPCSICDP